MGRGDEGWGPHGAFVYVRFVSAGSFLLALWRVLAASAPDSPSPWPFSRLGRGDKAGIAFILALSLRGRDAGRGVCPNPGPFPREGEGTWRVLRPAPYLLLIPPLTRGIEYALQGSDSGTRFGDADVVRSPTLGVANPTPGFPGRLTVLCGTACVRASSFHPPRRRAALATVLPVVRESAPGTGETHLALRPPVRGAET